MPEGPEIWKNKFDVFKRLKIEPNEGELLTQPCHLLSTAWTGLDDGYDNMEVDITVLVDPGESAYYYYSNVVLFANPSINKKNVVRGVAYAGIQTNGYSGKGEERVGKMAIFSAWGSTRCIKENNGWDVTFKELGTGYSVRIPYIWKENQTYKLRFSLEDKSEKEWLWAAYLTDTKTEEVTRIGRIFMPTKYGKIRMPKTFHERYFNPSHNIEDIETSVVRFSNMSANNGAVLPSAWEHIRIVQVPKYPKYFWYENLDNGFISAAGIAK